MASVDSVTMWSEDSDVVVLGFGLSGAVAAICAHDRDPDADILIVEKMPEDLAGGNSRVSGQTLFCPRNFEALLAYKRAMDAPNPLPEDVLLAWAEDAIALEPWLEAMAVEVGHSYVHRPRGMNGTTLVDFPEFPGSEAVEFNSTIEPNPSGVWNCFKAHADMRPIRTLYEAPAFDFVQDPDTLEVLGVLVRKNGSVSAIKARRAVVLCTGGFENNLAMLRDYWGMDRAYTLGTPGNTGDGVKMLQKAGADLWHMRSFTQGGTPAIKVPEYESAFMRHPVFPGASWIEVARDGRRFHNEAALHRLRHQRRLVHGQWMDPLRASVLPVHMIVDQAMLDSGPLVVAFEMVSWNQVVLGYKWSHDNRVEVDRGWIIKAGSIRELAHSLGRDSATLEATLARYNAACEAGHDADFGRAPETLRPLSGPPFYGIEIVPAFASTTGGGRRNRHSQVLAQNGEPIPRLYEAGELGSVTANLYQSGAFLTECLVSGRIAGRTAVQERAWSN